MENIEGLLERVVVDPAILAGKPVIRGTRISVYLIIELIAAGMGIGGVLKEYPELKGGTWALTLLLEMIVLTLDVDFAHIYRKYAKKRDR
jgi:uncharacterized protein (DUF433 family)